MLSEAFCPQETKKLIDGTGVQDVAGLDPATPGETETKTHLTLQG